MPTPGAAASSPGPTRSFKGAFIPKAEEAPGGWVRFHALRSLRDENEVVTFGFFDGSLEDLERSQGDTDFDERRRGASALRRRR